MGLFRPHSAESSGSLPSTTQLPVREQGGKPGGGALQSVLISVFSRLSVSAGGMGATLQSTLTGRG